MSFNENNILTGMINSFTDYSNPRYYTIAGFYTDKMGKFNGYKYNNHTHFIEAASNGYIDLVYTHRPKNDDEIRMATNKAARNGHYDLFLYLYYLLGREKRYESQYIFYACKGGYLPIIKFLLEDNNKISFLDELIEAAADKGHLEAVFFLEKMKKRKK